MSGLITTKHLFTNARVIVSEFGILCYIRCLRGALFSRKEITFLEMACRF